MKRPASREYRQKKRWFDSRKKLKWKKKSIYNCVMKQEKKISIGQNFIP